MKVKDDSIFDHQSEDSSSSSDDDTMLQITKQIQ